ncbi:MAG: bifunctional 4-hydroxy-2-oxoglutarate aldolase/2-dehydro-3-deoxy-phosphogluconate aldolase [candidate division KSB1 bacterium]|nr:bifunctional 4-hydroxy-2-oxoglutarate aldolase/2-dehydro-3-deoxy-phosphogluconate aldolase [candidate division KSB1 bacterium]
MTLKRFEVYNLMYNTGVVPLFYHPDADTAIKTLDACYKGGLRILEYTNRGPRAHEVFRHMAEHAAQQMPDMVLGVGSVVTPETSDLYIQLGAKFVVSPLLNPDMARTCNRRKVGWIPGCSTASEISRAEELGAEVVKVYPATLLGGPKFIKTMLAPCPWMSLMPSQGVAPTRENLTEWFDAGAFCVGMGSKIITGDILKNGRFDQLEKNMRDLLELITDIKS